MARAFYKVISKPEIVAEYSAASQKANEFEKLKWGSRESMENRFHLGLSLIDWQAVKRWIDMGCGTGLFFRMAENAGYQFEELVGVDLTPKILEYARREAYSTPCRFLCADLGELPGTLGSFDLLTLVGVLQQCGEPPETALSRSLHYLKQGGQIFLTTKHLGWQAFTDGSLLPDRSHSWFTYDEIRRAIQEQGVEILQAGGFLPREGKVVTPALSHTMFFFGKKQA